MMVRMVRKTQPTSNRSPQLTVIRRRPSSELGSDCRVRAQRDKHALRASGKCAGQHVGVWVWGMWE
jgi:hypothetical protein